MMATRSWRGLAVALAVIAGVVACSGSPEKEGSRASTPDSTMPPGYVPFSDADAGFVIAIPEHWQIPRNAELLQQQADAAREQNPRLAEMLSAARTLVIEAKVFAIDPDGSATVNLLVRPLERASLEDFSTLAVNESRRRGATIVSEERTSLGGIPAVKLSMKVPFTGESTLDQVQYYAIKGGKAFTLTLTGQDPALDIIAKSVRIT